MSTIPFLAGRYHGTVQAIGYAIVADSLYFSWSRTAVLFTADGTRQVQDHP
jgi:hypothetical protein